MAAQGPSIFDAQPSVSATATATGTPHPLDLALDDSPTAGPASRKKSRSSRDAAAIKRRCVSTACIACRRRKSKCDGNMPACAACSSVYGTECVYDPNSDHRRKGVYKEKIDSLKTKNSTLQVLIQAILNAAEDDVPALIRQIRTCESLDDVAEAILKQEQGVEDEEDDLFNGETLDPEESTFETEISNKMGELRLENGSVRFIGGTSNLIYLSPADDEDSDDRLQDYEQQDEPLTTWTTVTKDTEVIVHLINMYFTWHYPYFTTLSKSLFYRDFLLGKPPGTPKRTAYCSSLLVNAMLALGCHFTNSPAACADPGDPTTKGDLFFAEAKRLIVDNDEYERPKLTTVQTLALMSVREAGCGREAKGWVYSGMSFRMAQDMGLNLDSGMVNSKDAMDEKDVDARRVTFWGCFLFDKCWSNYLGRLPQLPASNITVPKYDVFPDEDANLWSPYTDNGVSQLNSQPSRTRTIGLQLSALCEISSDLLAFFYNPQQLERPQGKSSELKKLSELHTRLEAWRKDLPKELEPKEGQLPNVLLMHMFFHLLYIHLFRPFLKYDPKTSPLPAHVSPRKLCTQAAALISKLMRLYKRTYGLRQICNIAVYMVHSACTIHLLNLPDKTAKRDIVHGVKHLEEIAEDWLCARRTLSILSVLARKWRIELPEEASTVLARTDAKYGTFSTADVPSPKSEAAATPPSGAPSPPRTMLMQSPASAPNQFYMSPQAQRSVSASPIVMNTNVNGSRSLAAAIPSSVLLPQRLHNGVIATSSSRLPGGNMNIQSDTSMQLSHPFASRHPFTMPGTRQSHMSQSSSTSASASASGPSPPTTLTRQTSPSTMFGGVDALVESQDWWLRDQANLAVGFGNWNSIDFGSASGLEGSPLSSNNNNNNTSTNSTDGVPGLNGNFFMPDGRNGTFDDKTMDYDHDWLN